MSEAGKWCTRCNLLGVLALFIDLVLYDGNNLFLTVLEVVFFGYAILFWLADIRTLKNKS